MLRTFLNKLTGTHITILGLGAMLVPGALYAVPAYNNVAIENPNTGVRAGVDSTGHLLTNDSVGNYVNTPGNYVRIYALCNSGNSGASIYTAPSGKALILKSVGFTHYSGTTGSDNYNYIYGSSYLAAGFDDVNAAGAHSIDLGNGFYVQNSESLTSYCVGGTWLATITGYLVPASLVPASGTAEAAAQSVHAGPQVMKGGKRL